MRFNPKARLDTGRVSDSGGRGRSGAGGRMRGGAIGGGRGQIPIPTGGKAGGGVAIVIAIVFFVVTQCAGVDLTGGGGPGTSTGGFDTSRVAAPDSARYANCKTGADAAADEDCARIAVENSLYDYWATTLPQATGTDFQPATMRTFTGAVSTGCGQATSQVGPFYCPPDATIYLDTSFFQQVLQGALGGPNGAFVEPYVIGHEYGHHIQNVLGTMSRVRTQQGPRSDAVRLELQADCYAGLWARAATRTEDADGNVLITEITDQDIQEAIAAAEAVGDDRIQEKTQGQVTQESWTHGSAASRVKWFQTGFQSGDVNSCDTWAVDTP